MSVQPSFIFGGNTGVSSPEELARLRAVADALAAPRAPKNVGEGLTALGDALGYRMTVGKANDMQAAGNASASSAIMSALGGGQFPAAPTGAGAAPSAASPSSVDASAPGGDYFSAIRSAESGGSDSAKNPTSSATGRYQFTTGTWGDVAKAHPDLGLTPDGRLDPAQQEKAIRAFTADNANVLSNAGIPTTGGNLYAAHFLGAGGATNVLTKPDNSPVSAYVGPEVVKANPFLAGMSVGDFKQWAARHGGGGGPVQVASTDPSAGVAQALGGGAPQMAAPSPVAAALQLPQQGPIPQGRPDVVAALNGAPPGAVGGPAAVTPAGQRVLGQMMNPLPMGGNAMQMQPPAAAQSAPPLPSSQIAPDPMGAAPAQAPQAQQQPAPGDLPVMAGGSSDAIAPGGHAPTMQQIMALASNPWAMQKYGPIIQTLLAQQMKQSDPAYALDIATKKAGLALDQQKLGGSFRGDSMDAQAWNILQTRDPSSKEYQTAYAIVSQPKNQLVQTPQGQQLIAVPPTLPSWLKPPGGDAGGAQQAGNAAPAGPGGAAAIGAPIAGTQPVPNEQRVRNSQLYSVVKPELDIVEQNFPALADPKNQLWSKLPAGSDIMTTPEYQRAANSLKTIIASYLYSTSGATANPGEVENQASVLTPKIGESQASIDDKLRRIRTMVDAIHQAANGGQPVDASPAPAAPTGAGKKVIDGYTIEEVQ